MANQFSALDSIDSDDMDEELGTELIPSPDEEYSGIYTNTAELVALPAQNILAEPCQILKEQSSCFNHLIVIVCRLYLGLVWKSG